MDRADAIWAVFIALVLSVGFIGGWALGYVSGRIAERRERR